MIKIQLTLRLTTIVAFFIFTSIFFKNDRFSSKKDQDGFEQIVVVFVHYLSIDLGDLYHYFFREMNNLLSFFFSIGEPTVLFYVSLH